MKTAIVLGATGLTGGILLQKLLKDTRYEKVILFSRSSAAVKNEKVEEHLVDLFKLEKQKEIFKADEVYCCIGTTRSKTPDDEVYKKIDYGIPVNAAKLARENGIQSYLVISALGADSESKIFYNRTKGEMEQEVLAQKIPGTYIFEPSLIAGEREEKRPFESLAKYAMNILNFVLVGPLEKYRSIEPEIIAEAMITVANNGYSKKLIPSVEIKQIVSSQK